MRMGSTAIHEYNDGVIGDGVYRYSVKKTDPRRHYIQPGAVLVKSTPMKTEQSVTVMRNDRNETVQIKRKGVIGRVTEILEERETNDHVVYILGFEVVQFPAKPNDWYGWQEILRMHYKWAALAMVEYLDCPLHVLPLQNAPAYGIISVEV